MLRTTALTLRSDPAGSGAAAFTVFLFLIITTGTQAFTVMVDINTMNATEAARASLLRCDGIWFTNANSPTGINWSQVVDDISPNKFSVSEDVHCCGPPVCGSQQCYPPATDYAQALKAGCEVFGSFVYDEPKCTLNNTELDSLLPAYNNRIIVHSRAWFPPHDQDVIDVIDHSGVVGVTFEANPDHLFADYFKIPRGVAMIQALNHDVFVLAPPWSNCSNYTASIKYMMKQLADDPGVVMHSDRLHIVLANYAEWDTHVYFFGDENNSIHGALQFLRNHSDYTGTQKLPGAKW